ncbi:conserved hypothetical protein [Stenotrophomonas maltophilia]
MSNYKKALADVQPGGRVRLGDQALRVFSAGRWTYDGTGQSFSHEEMDAAAFVVYRDAALSAPPSPVAYHGDVDLKWLSSSISEVAHRLSTYMPTGLAEWADRARDCRIAAQVLSELSAQPSPAGQGGLNYERMFVDACAALAEVSRELGCDPEQAGAEPILAAIAELREALAARQPVGDHLARDRKMVSQPAASNQPSGNSGELDVDGARQPVEEAPPCWWIDHGTYGQITQRQDEADAAVNAGKRVVSYAARQPVGEPVGYLYDWTHSSALGRGEEIFTAFTTDIEVARGSKGGVNIRPVYAALPEQVVDLGQFRQPVQDWLDGAQASMEEHGDYDGVFGYAIEEGTRLLALIDSQAVGK